MKYIGNKMVKDTRSWMKQKEIENYKYLKLKEANGNYYCKRWCLDKSRLKALTVSQKTPSQMLPGL